MATALSKPKLALRVGLVRQAEVSVNPSSSIFHRVVRILQDLKNTSVKTPDEVRVCYHHDPVVLKFVHSLADTNDLAIASSAADLGYELNCLLPLNKEAFQEALSDEADKAKYEKLIGHKPVLFELNGGGTAGGKNIETIGQFLIGQCDILIAIWNKAKGQDKETGMDQIVDSAIERQMPVICIHPNQTSDWLMDPETDRKEQLLAPPLFAKIVDDRVRPPWLRGTSRKEIDRQKEDLDFTGAYLRSKRTSTSLLSIYWDVFIWAMTIGVKYEKRSSTDVPDKAFKSHMDLADKLAGWYSGLYRGAFLANYKLGVCAVFLALLGYASAAQYKYWLIGELATVAIILVLVLLLWSRCWHVRMVDCRYLAECLRIAGYLRPLGMPLPDPHLAAHHSHASVKDSWMRWRIDVIVREAGMPGEKMSADHLSKCLDYIGNWLDGQIHYHSKNEKKMSRTGKALHYVAWICVAITVSACILHFSIHDARFVPWLTLCAAGFPAAAGACHAISTQGEFHKLAERSGSMYQSLKELKIELDQIKKGPIDRESLAKQALSIAEIMLEEVTDWQILYRKPPVMPG